MATGVGSDVQRSLGTVVAGGLVMATLMTLFLLPTFYFVTERLAARFAEARARGAAQVSA
jgi:cobalt-zinc-cadmium resistance protein CzcA